MHGGRPMGRILLVVALVALPLVGLAVLLAQPVGGTASPQEAVLRLVPGQGGEGQAVRPAPDTEVGARVASAARDLGLLAVLLAAAAALALGGASSAPPLRAARIRAGREIPAAGRGPPSRFPR
jgi:hypothetical protein